MRNISRAFKISSSRRLVFGLAVLLAGVLMSGSSLVYAQQGPRMNKTESLDDGGHAPTDVSPLEQELIKLGILKRGKDGKPRRVEPPPNADDIVEAAPPPPGGEPPDGEKEDGENKAEFGVFFSEALGHSFAPVITFVDPPPEPPEPPLDLGSPEENGFYLGFRYVVPYNVPEFSIPGTDSDVGAPVEDILKGLTLEISPMPMIGPSVLFLTPEEAAPQPESGGIQQFKPVIGFLPGPNLQQK